MLRGFYVPLKGLIAFDLDGTLVHIWSAWSWIHRFLGTLDAAKPYADAYHTGEIDYQRWAELDVELWHGVEFNRIKKAIKRELEFIPGSNELIRALHDRGFKTAIISSGLAVFADQAKAQLGIDISRANRLRVDEKGLISGVEVVVAFDNKHKVLMEIAQSLNIPLSQCVAIGDSRNDIPMFEIAGLSIAFNTTDEEVLSKAVMAIQSKNALDLLPPLLQYYGTE